MSSMNARAVGFTQAQEKALGADLSLWQPVGKPLVLQYKRPRNGVDFHSALFRINTNGTDRHPPTQHRALDALSRRNFCDVFYVLPLVIHNREFVASFGRLSDESVYVPASWITDSVTNRSSGWMDEWHHVLVTSRYDFLVESTERGRGRGLSKKELLQKIAANLKSEPNQSERD